MTDVENVMMRETASKTMKSINVVRQITSYLKKSNDKDLTKKVGKLFKEHKNNKQKLVEKLGELKNQIKNKDVQPIKNSNTDKKEMFDKKENKEIKRDSKEMVKGSADKTKENVITTTKTAVTKGKAKNLKTFKKKGKRFNTVLYGLKNKRKSDKNAAVDKVIDKSKEAIKTAAKVTKTIITRKP